LTGVSIIRFCYAMIEAPDCHLTSWCDGFSSPTIQLYMQSIGTCGKGGLFKNVLGDIDSAVHDFVKRSLYYNFK